MRLRANDADVLRAMRVVSDTSEMVSAAEARAAMATLELYGAAVPKTDGGMLARLRRMEQRELVAEVTRDSFSATRHGWAQLQAFERRAAQSKG